MSGGVFRALLEVVEDGFEIGDAVGLELPALEVEEDADEEGEVSHRISEGKGHRDLAV